MPTLAVEFDLEKLNNIDLVVEDAIIQRGTPGAVVCVGRGDEILYKKAFGYLSDDKTYPTTYTTRFDLASLTKVFTSIAIVMLAEKGKIRLSDPVCKYLREFAAKGKESITIEHLLLHVSGLPACNNLEDYKFGYPTAVENICKLDLKNNIGEQYIYSDLGHIILGELSGICTRSSDEIFMKGLVFEPLKMRRTCYLGSKYYEKDLFAPTELINGELLQGVVHDPRSRLMDGVTGHAGIFSTVGDLAKLCQMLLNDGKFGDKQILSKRAVEKLFQVYELPNGVKRTVAFDVVSPHSTFKGDFLPNAVGHTGFTGTSMLIDRESNLYIIILTNRTLFQPDNPEGIKALRGAIANIVAASIN